MKETGRSENKRGVDWNTERPNNAPSTAAQRFLDVGGIGENSLRTRYNQEAITQPLRRPSDDDILPPGRH